MISHKRYMEMALQLAEKGRGYVNPNPLVGCVIVKRGKVIGKGFHKKYGEAHAEIIALKEAGTKARNAIMYGTLEPCSHWGKTPPCTLHIIEAGISEVIIAMKDPNPIIKGNDELKANGIKLKTGILREEAEKQNESYIKFIKTGKPFVVLKLALSLDGKIATSSGDSKYITGIESRTYAHKMRHNADAVMVGINTVKKDNPFLDARLIKGKNPLKIIVDSKLQVPEKANVLIDPSKVILATTTKAKKEKIEKWRKKGVVVLQTKPKQGMVDLKELMEQLGKKSIISVMIEGGASLAGSAIKEKIVDKIAIFTAPKIIGKGMDAVKNIESRTIGKAISLKKTTIKQIGKDVLVEGYL